MDKEIQEIQKEISKAKLKIEREKARISCENLMSKYQNYHMRGMRTEETHLFALKTPGVCAEMLWGIYDESEGILRWKKNEGYGSPRPRCTLSMHCMTTPIIEVAEDGETARGLWIMIGTETGKIKGNDLQAYWVAGQFAMDFIKENGEWKIWKYNTTGLIYSPFEKGWHIDNHTMLDFLIQKENSRPDDQKVDRAASHPWMWSPNSSIQNIPKVPTSYKTWDDSLSCVHKPDS